MVCYVINKLLTKPIHNIVCERGIDISGAAIDCNHIVYINDVRGAAFYALGLSQKTQEPVILVVREEYIANIFTGLTEAWFQQREIYVVAIGKEILNVDISFLKPCTQAIIKVQTMKDFDRASESLQDMSVPIVYLVQDNKPEHEDICKFDVSPLVSSLKEEEKVLAYEPVCNCSLEGNIEYITSDDKYGMISKYMGIILGTDINHYLVTSVESVDLDMNIFNNRYMSSKFKIVIVGNKLDDSKRHWLEKNGIYLYDNIVFNDDTCKEFIGFDTPTVWNVVQTEAPNVY